jgi:large subunit ribosomal protein L4
MQINVVDAKKKRVGKVELPSSIYETEIKSHLFHDVVVWQMANRRRGTHSTKTRNEVRGGGRKPWKQKGLGRARAGSIRSPLFRGGGVTFGPKPKCYGYKLPKKVKQAALKSALSLKAKDEAMIVLDKIEFAEAKTKQAVSLLASLGITGRALIVQGERSNNVELSFRNIPEVSVVTADRLSVYDILNSDILLCLENSLDSIEKKLS